MIFVGCDPGKNGAIIGLTEEGRIEIMSPLFFLEDGSVDYKRTKQFFTSLRDSETDPRVFLERAMPMAMGAKHAFTYGRDFGALEIAIQESGLPLTYVEPSKWPKSVCEGIDKDLKPKVRSVMAARKLFPEEIAKIPVSPKAKNIHEGYVDALLIAEWGRRQRLLAS